MNSRNLFRTMLVKLVKWIKIKWNENYKYIYWLFFLLFGHTQVDRFLIQLRIPGWIQLNQFNLIEFQMI
jgi:hypothetical protein